MVNLLSPKQRAALTELYVLRLTTVTFASLAIAGAAVATLLAPSFLVIHAEADQAEEYVKTASQLASERAKSQSQETLSTFNEAVSQLKNTAKPASFAHILELTTQERPSGVYLSSVQVVYDGAGNANVTISGTARTRAELIAYANTLKKTPELAQVVVPVSALVADVNASFSVTLVWNRPKS